MKKFLYFVAILYISVALFHQGLRCKYISNLLEQRYTIQPQGPLTKEQQASHRIAFLGEDGERVTGYCSSTAVGAHALLTAEHCKVSVGDKIQIDYAPHFFKVIKVIGDDNEHTTVLLDGPPFTDLVHISEVSAPAISGEEVVIYGDGEGQYPPLQKRGTVSYPYRSDQEIKSGEFDFTIPVIPGDSGSAIYNKNGSIIGLVTYASSQGGTGFPLHFTKDQIDEIEKFDGKTEVKLF